MHAELIALRLIHIVCGIFWVGSGLFSAIFLAPALASSGADAGRVMAALAQRKLFVVMPVAAVLTILSGARLLSIASAGFTVSYMRSPSGRMFAWSGTFAIVAFVLSLVLGRPFMLRAGKLAAAAASAAEGERARLLAQAAAARRIGGIASTIALVLLVLAAAGMSVARYVS